MSSLKEAIEAAPYVARLGAVVDALEDGSARLRLPFKQENSNPGDALHGGVAASMIDLGGLTVARHTLGDDAGPIHTASIQVSYLAAAIGEGIDDMEAGNVQPLREFDREFRKRKGMP